MREREQANEVRRAAAASLAKLERWNELSAWVFEELQQATVETSELLLKSKDVVQARDFFWKSVNAAKLSSRKRFLDEQIEGAYVGLYAYSPSSRDIYKRTIDQLRLEEEAMYKTILLRAEEAIFRFRGRMEFYTTADLGNALRAVLAGEKESYGKRVANALGRIDSMLYEIVRADDRAVLTGTEGKR